MGVSPEKIYEAVDQKLEKYYHGVINKNIGEKKVKVVENNHETSEEKEEKKGDRK